jgi:hypothetical protein
MWAPMPTKGGKMIATAKISEAQSMGHKQYRIDVVEPLQIGTIATITDITDAPIFGCGYLVKIGGGRGDGERKFVKTLERAKAYVIHHFAQRAPGHGIRYA